MLVDAYGSDNSDASGDECAPHSHSTTPEDKLNSSSPLSLPVPSSSKLSLPAPKAKKALKKIAINLPTLTKDSSLYDENEARPAKKLRTESRGAGSSALFSMLPAPKLAAPVKAAPEQILGSGKGPGLVFNEVTKDTSNKSSNDDIAEQAHLSFMPTSVRKGKANISLEEASEKVTVNTRGPSSPATVDLFSLSSHSTHLSCS